MSRSRLTRATVLALATIVVIGVFVGAADATIGPVEARLTIGSGSSFNCLVSVSGRVGMTPTEAQGLINSGHKVLVRLWGDDPVSDDLLRGPISLPNPNGRLSVTLQGLVFDLNQNISVHTLNEDTLLGPFDLDEIYAGVRLVNSGGTTIRAAETNRVKGTFGQAALIGSRCVRPR
jgi:hypothetical protein